MVVRCSRLNGRLTERSRRSLLDTDGVDVAAANLEDDARQRPPRRTADRYAGPQIEASFVTGTVEDAFAGRGITAHERCVHF